MQQTNTHTESNLRWTWQATVLLILGILPSSCTETLTGYHNFTSVCDNEIHQFDSIFSEEMNIDEIHIHIVPEDENLAEEEHSLEFTDFSIDENTKEKLTNWTLQLNYGDVSGQYTPNKTTLISCDSPRTVEFIVYNDSSILVYENQIFMDSM